MCVRCIFSTAWWSNTWYLPANFSNHADTRITPARNTCAMYILNHVVVKRVVLEMVLPRMPRRVFPAQGTCAGVSYPLLGITLQSTLLGMRSEGRPPARNYPGRLSYYWHIYKYEVHTIKIVDWRLKKMFWLEGNLAILVASLNIYKWAQF